MDKEELKVEFARLQLSKFQKSQDIEWKVNFGLWGFLAMFGSAVIFGKNVSRVVANADWLFVAGCVLTALHFSWLFKIQMSQNKDFGCYVELRDAVIGTAAKYREKTRCCCRCFAFFFWPLMSAAMTFFLVLGIKLLMA